MTSLRFTLPILVGLSVGVLAPVPGSVQAQVHRADSDRSNATFLTFEAGSATPTALFRPQIAALAKTWKRQNMRAINIIGHAEAGGDHVVAAGLSQARAEAVKAELVRNGIRPQYINVFWHGDRDVDGRSEDGNRDVVAVVLVW